MQNHLQGIQGIKGFTTIKKIESLRQEPAQSLYQRLSFCKQKELKMHQI